MKAAHCTRRAGKSYGCGLYLFKEAYENPNSSVLYIAQTKKNAERIMWKDVLKDISRKFKLDAKFHDQDLKVVLPNGSIIYLEGADSSVDAKDKFLGQKFRLIILDEIAKFRNDPEGLIFDILMPCLADYQGTLAMIGTSNNLVQSYFAQVTQGKVKGWAVHKWSALHNPHMRKQFLAEIARLKEANPKAESEPWFRQNYLGEWVVDDQALIYKYDRQQVEMRDEPTRLNYALGVTLSYTGLSAFSVVGSGDEAREAFIVETRSYKDNSIYRAIETIQELDAVYGFTKIVCAEASKRLVEELRSRFGVPIEEAPEKDKPALLRLFATELSAGHIRVLPKNQDLLNEWDSIIIDPRSVRGPLREHPACQTQIATAALYAWQTHYNYLYSKAEVSDDPLQKYWDHLKEEQENEQTDPFTDYYGDPRTYP